MTSTQKSRTTKARLSRSIGLSALILAVSGGVAFAQAVVVHGNRRVDAETIRSYAAGRENPQEIRESLLATGLFSNVQVSRRGAQTVISVQEQGGTVNRVAFEGNRRLKSEQLSQLVQSRAGGPLSQALIDSDVERLREAYRRAGYGLSSVSGRIAPLPNGRQDVVYTINESSKTGIKSINFSGNNVYSSGRLRGLMTSTESNFLSWIKTSDVYDPDRINSDLELIRRFYLKNGYADFQIVNNSARFDEQAGGWVVDIQVEEGPQYKVGNVGVDSSVPGVDAGRLQRYLATSTGDTYNAEAVEKSLVALTTEVNREGHAFAEQIRQRPIDGTEIEMGEHGSMPSRDVAGNGQAAFYPAHEYRHRDVQQQVEHRRGDEGFEDLEGFFLHGARTRSKLEQADGDGHRAVLDSVEEFGGQGRKDDAKRHGQQHIAVGLRRGQTHSLARHALSSRQGRDAGRQLHRDARRHVQPQAHHRRKEGTVGQLLDPVAPGLGQQLRHDEIPEEQLHLFF